MAFLSATTFFVVSWIGNVFRYRQRSDLQMMLFSDKVSKLILKLLTYIAIKHKFKYTLEVVSIATTESVNCRCLENLIAVYVYHIRILRFYVLI